MVTGIVAIVDILRESYPGGIYKGFPFGHNEKLYHIRSSEAPAVSFEIVIMTSGNVCCNECAASEVRRALFSQTPRCYVGLSLAGGDIFADEIPHIEIPDWRIKPVTIKIMPACEPKLWN